MNVKARCPSSWIPGAASDYRIRPLSFGHLLDTYGPRCFPGKSASIDILIEVYSQWRGGRVVEYGGLENR